MDKILNQYGLYLKFQSKEHGYQLCANKRFKAGDIVFKQPIMVTAGVSHNRCHWCLKESSTSLFRCSRCQVTRYCSRECQIIDWKQNAHVIVCKFLKEVKDSHDADHDGDGLVLVNGTTNNQKPKERSDSVQNTTDDIEEDEHQLQNEDKNNILTSLKRDAEMLLKCVLAIYDSTYSGKINSKYNLDLFNRMVHHFPHLSKETLTHFHKVIDLIKPYLPENVNTQDLLVYLARFHSNNFEVCDVYARGFAECLAPFGALLNHSCAPNCEMVYEGRYQLVRALADIESGQELLGNYVDVLLERNKRQFKLKKQYFFQCSCERCDDESGSMAVVDSLFQPEIDELTQIMDKSGIKSILVSLWTTNKRWMLDNISDEYPKSSLEKGNTMKTFLLETIYHIEPVFNSSNTKMFLEHRSLYINSIIKIHLNEKGSNEWITHSNTLQHIVHVFDDSVAEGDWQIAMTAGLYILGRYMLVYPQYSPISTLHLSLFTKLIWNALGQQQMFTKDSFDYLNELVYTLAKLCLHLFKVFKSSSLVDDYLDMVDLYSIICKELEKSS